MIFNFELLSATEDEMSIFYSFYWEVNNGFLEALTFYHCQGYNLLAH